MTTLSCATAGDIATASTAPPNTQRNRAENFIANPLP
ncbi:Uncharacterised protein [Bordetella pertussis]|nr:Uncharacterised protein [Bordetella pertussis]CFW45557.1 Uncharacterised protein [Bordetella pertussis]